jgi:hypothetical protein
MAGTIAGGKAAAATNKSKYGADFYAKIGAIGGKKGTTGGFAAAVKCEDPNCPYSSWEPDHFKRECAGSKGGSISRRGKKHES